MLAVPRRAVLGLSYYASGAPARVEAYAILRGLRTGRIHVDEVPTITSFTTDRTRVSGGVSTPIEEASEIVGGAINGSTTLKRGEFYGELEYRVSGGRFQEICRGYQYAGFVPSFGDRIESISGRGLKVDNEAAVTLVNNTALTRTITVPTNARWLLYGGAIHNGDDVQRVVTIRADDGTDEQDLGFFASLTQGAGVDEAWPPTSANDRHMGNMPFPLSEADRIRITWAAGGASSGGEARSSAVVEEWIEQ